MNNHFDETLHDFVFDIAYGDAVRHLAKKGLTVKEISENLTYPASINNIAKIVFNTYLDEGIIKLRKPDTNESVIKKSRFIQEYDKYGHASFRLVEEEVLTEIKDYVACDFGKQKYNNPAEYLRLLQMLEKNDREYIEGLPWPLETVYHVKNKRMERIMLALHPHIFTD